MSSIMGGGPVVRHGINVGGRDDVMGSLVSSLVGRESDEISEIIGDGVVGDDKQVLIAAVLGLELFSEPFLFPDTLTLDQLYSAMSFNAGLEQAAKEKVGDYF